MKREYVLLVIILLLLPGCNKKTNSDIDNKYKNIVCFKETDEDDIIGASKIEAVFDQDKLYKLTYLDEVIFSGDSLKYLDNEVEYFKSYYNDKNKIKGINTEFKHDNTSYTASLTIDYEVIKNSDLEKLDLNYKFNKNISNVDLAKTLRTDNYICE